jgi:hypothetical protein
VTQPGRTLARHDETWTDVTVVGSWHGEDAAAVTARSRASGAGTACGRRGRAPWEPAGSASISQLRRASGWMSARRRIVTGRPGTAAQSGGVPESVWPAGFKTSSCTWTQSCQ